MELVMGVIPIGVAAQHVELVEVGLLFFLDRGERVRHVLFVRSK